MVGVANARRHEQGFTLIELLTVVAIIGVLAAIAVPQFVLYRQKAYDGMAESDLRNAITAEEAYYSSFSAYVTCADATTCQATLPGYKRSDAAVQLALTAAGAAFTGTSAHPYGSGKSWTFDSAGGRLLLSP